MNKLVLICTILCITSTIAKKSRRIHKEQPEYYKDPIYRLEQNLNPEDGQYNFGFESNRSARDEVRGSDGVTRGFYTYIDDQNEQRHVEYSADGTGFHIHNGGLTETDEVAKARKEHLEAYAVARKEALSRVNVPQYDEEEGVYFTPTAKPEKRIQTVQFNNQEYEVQTPRKPVVFEPIPVVPKTRRPTTESTTFFEPIPVQKSRKISRRPAVIHQPINPRKIQSRKPSTNSNLFSTNPNTEPCHGPLCKLKYTNLESDIIEKTQSQIVKTQKPRHRVRPTQKIQQHQQEFISQPAIVQPEPVPEVKQVSQPEKIKPEDRDEKLMMLLEAAKAYADFVNGKH